MKRKWTNIKLVEDQIKELRNAGKTRQEIADELGLEKVQIKSWISRYNRKQRQLEHGIVPRRRGRPSKGYQLTEQEKDNEIKRLKMGNELLRDFLQIAGRK